MNIGLKALKIRPYKLWLHNISLFFIKQITDTKNTRYWYVMGTNIKKNGSQIVYTGKLGVSGIVSGWTSASTAYLR